MEIALYAYDFFHLLILTGQAWPIAYGKVKLASFVGRNWTWMVTICWPTQEKGQAGVDSAQLIMSRPESSNRPNSGSGSRPGSRSALGVAGASISVKESLEILQNASKSSEKETEVLKEARAAVASMKETTEKLEKTVVEAESACKTHSSLDAKWEEFKAKFDALNRMAVEKIMGLGGSSTSDLRPASRISSARVAQVLRRSQNLVVLKVLGFRQKVEFQLFVELMVFGRLVRNITNLKSWPPGKNIMRCQQNYGDGINIDGVFVGKQNQIQVILL